ncbi:solute carrier organic anion transporter family member 4C1-like [Cimex lectularius]|uniref:Solute carrier organic anion transporter family member n=1 Tax=Cimex lectularius TaxID=79782 RepID=A0A8I6S9N4_CIMLE|nr:solute carrier organic anion transporter family member 4C1-like [Cimex lectularius]
MVAQESPGVTVPENALDDLEVDSENQDAEHSDETKRLNNGDGDSTEANKIINDTVNKEDLACGFPCWQPAWLQQIASKKAYVIVYGLLGMSQTAIGTYFVGTISTIEKRFKLPSSTSGLITSSWDIGSLSTAMVMAYFGSAGHKTRWVATAAILAAMSCYIRYIPQLLYGPGETLAAYNKTTSNMTGNMCNDEKVFPENCSLNSEGLVATIALTLAHIIFGIGTSSYYTLGAAYLDDNTLKNKFPVLFAMATCIRYFGPTLGFLTSSYTLAYYVDSDVTPPFGQNDARWIGAWYKGWIPLGTVHLFLALIMAMFPKILPREAERRVTSGAPLLLSKKSTSIQDFKKTLLRLIKNPILMLNTTSSTFYILGMMGYFIFLPKYIEYQFHRTASNSSLITGLVGLICTAIGVLTSGYIVSKFKPRARYLAAWNVFTETVDIIGHAMFAYLGCYKNDLAGSINQDGTWNLIEECNANCSCMGRLPYSPVCSEDQLTTYYSPCHAGCTEFEMINNTKTFFNCSCIGGSGIATSGACPVDCSNHFIIFLCLLCFMKFLSATGRAGNTIIQFRSVKPEDKSISIALAEVVVCALAFIPAPIMYGFLLDYSCLVWGETCGKTGNCWLYEGKTMRYLLNFTATGFLFIATVLDIGVLCNVGSLKIYDEDVNKEENKDNKETEIHLLEQKK